MVTIIKKNEPICYEVRKRLIVFFFKKKLKLYYVNININLNQLVKKGSLILFCIINRNNNNIYFLRLLI